MKIMVGIDGSNIGQKAFDIACRMVDKTRDTLYAVNIYSVGRIGKYQFHKKDNPIERILPNNTLYIKDNGSIFTEGTDEEVLLFIDGCPVGDPLCQFPDSGRAHVGNFHQLSEEGVDKIFHGPYSSDPIGRKEVVFVEKASDKPPADPAARKRLASIKTVEKLSPQNRPRALKLQYESRVIGAHILNSEILIVPKEANETTKDTFARLTKKYGIDMLVLGSFGTKNNTEVLGSTADVAFRNFTCGVAIVKNTSTVPEGPKTCLLAVDGSESAKRAFECTAQLLGQNDTIIGYYISSAVDPIANEQRVREIRKQYDDCFQKYGVGGRIIVASPSEGMSTGDQIIHAALANNAHFILLGTDGATAQAKKEGRLGSVSSHVVHHSPVSTITYKMPTIYSSYVYGNYEKCFAGW